jgi:hypothetical protein
MRYGTFPSLANDKLATFPPKPSLRQLQDPRVSFKTPRQVQDPGPMNAEILRTHILKTILAGKLVTLPSISTDL